MTDLIIILILMFLCHLLADYPLQGWLATAKAKSYWKDTETPHDWAMALICHSMMWGIMIYLPFIFIGEIDFGGWIELVFWLTLPINIVLHIFIDNLKANKKKIDLITDQCLHFFQITMTWLFYVLLLCIF